MERETPRDAAAGVTSVNLSIPAPPAGLSYGRYEDFKYQALLTANGIALDDDALIAALDHPIDALKAAAAHTLGLRHVRAAIPALKAALASSDDLVQVEAAYALARMGESAGREALVTYLGYRLDAYLSPPVAAGYLAQLGDPRGFDTVAKALEAELDVVRLPACRQLFYFVPFQGRQDGDGRMIDVFPLYARALRDPAANVRQQALLQLRELRPAGARGLLEDAAANASDGSLRAEAAHILANLPG